ncbi:hypothetical protein SCALM49S_09669 [Streptomyces californicus]
MVGPDDLTPEGMAAVLSEVLDRPVRAEFVTGAEHKARMIRSGASEAWAQSMADMADAQNGQGFYGAARPDHPRPRAHRISASGARRCSSRRLCRTEPHSSLQQHPLQLPEPPSAAPHHCGARARWSGAGRAWRAG